MNWQAFGAIGEFVGAIAVVGSLVYVSLQLRSGTRALRTNTRDSVYRSLQEWNYVVMSDPELGWIFQEGSRDLESLDEQQQARYFHVMYSFFKVFENIYLHVLAGAAPESTWIQNRAALSAYAHLPGARHYWENRRATFHPAFQEAFDGLEQAMRAADELRTVPRPSGDS